MIYQDINSLLVPELGTVGTNLFWSHMPATPNSAIAIYEYPGEAPVYTKKTMEWELPRIQVVTRALTYVEAMTKAEEVYTILSNIRRTDIDGTFYDYIRARQRPFADPNGRDDGGRFRAFCNYAIKKTP
jgi:hypothetical protein